jgi:DNA-binding MarR family transcriptional regulator
MPHDPNPRERCAGRLRSAGSIRPQWASRRPLTTHFDHEHLAGNMDTSKHDEVPDDELLRRVFEARRELRRGAVRKLNKAFHSNRKDALDPAQMDTLEVIASRPSWRMIELAQALYLDPSTVTRSIDRLVATGHVTRVASKDDGRGVRVRASRRGRDLCKDVAPRRLAVMREILSDMSLAECKELARLLDKHVKDIAAYADRLDSQKDSPKK